MVEKVLVYNGVEIVAVGSYFPVRSGNADAYSRTILDFKNGNESAIEQMTQYISDLLDKRSMKSKSFYIATVPSSTAHKQHKGFPQLINNLTNTFNVLNPHHNIIRRTVSKKPAHLGGSRSTKLASETTDIPIRIQNMITGQYVVLLDDVTTTGNSLKAAIDLLIKHNAVVSVAIALGRTSW
jgi:predicted amidophosphoribosyltransferase